MYLIIGANGFLGSYILKHVLQKTDDKIIAVARDISRVKKDLRIEWIGGDISDRSTSDRICEHLTTMPGEEVKVVFLAAYHNPDLVEKNPRIAWNVNVTSLSYFINRIENIKCFFYPSTDSVYGNSEGSYHFKETDELKPVNTYGVQKTVAEKIVTGYGYNVVRYPFLIAPSLSPVKKHFYDKILESLRNGQSIEMFEDSLRSTLSFDTAAELLIKLMENYSDKIPKILNICGDDDYSKYDVGLMIAESMGAEKDLIVPVKTAASVGIFEANRAQSTLMNNSLVKKILGLSEIKLELPQIKN